MRKHYYKFKTAKNYDMYKCVVIFIIGLIVLFTLTSCEDKEPMIQKGLEAMIEPTPSYDYELPVIIVTPDDNFVSTIEAIN